MWGESIPTCADGSALRWHQAADRRRQGNEDSDGEERLRKPGRDSRPHRRKHRRRRAAANCRRTAERQAAEGGGGRVADEAVHLDAVAGDQLIDAAVVDGDDDMTLGPCRRSRRARREPLLAAADRTETVLGRVLQLTTCSRAQLQQLQSVTEPLHSISTRLVFTSSRINVRGRSKSSYTDKVNHKIMYVHHIWHFSNIVSCN